MLLRGLYSFGCMVFGDTSIANVVSPRFFMYSEDKCISLIEEITELCLYDKAQKRFVQEQKGNEFFLLCDEISELYKSEKEFYQKMFVEPFIMQYPFLKSCSSSFLNVIGKEKKETYHSLYLQYIFSEKNQLGYSILLDFCNMFGFHLKEMQTFEKGSYEVNVEYSTKRQRKKSWSWRRMDLLIKDKSDKWLIVIENKIDSNVRQENGSQLKAYQDFCNSHRRFSKIENRNKLYVLLSYKDNRTDADEYGWKYMDYYVLFKLLLKYAERDGIIKDYLRTLYSILFSEFPISDDCNTENLSRCSLFCKRVIFKCS